MVSLFIAQCRSLGGTAVKENKELGQPHPHPFSSTAITLVHKAPFNSNAFYSGCLLLLIQIPFCYLIHSIYQPSNKLDPEHNWITSLPLEKTNLRARIQQFYKNALWVFIFYKTVTKGNFMQAEIKSLEKNVAVTKGSYSVSV